LQIKKKGKNALSFFPFNILRATICGKNQSSIFSTRTLGTARVWRHTNSALFVTDFEDAGVPMLRDNNQLDRHTKQSTHLRPQLTSQYAEAQRKRMLIALGILLVALAAVLVKDWDFWFPAKGEIQEIAEQSKNISKPATTNSTVPVPTASTPTPPAREHKPDKSKMPSVAPPPVVVPFSATTTERAALPPLQVEVVAGNRHIDVPPKSNAIHLDVAPGAPPTTPGVAETPKATANAGDRVHLSPQTRQSVSVSVPPDYPLLARQMKVQGAVSLQALISRDGTIQELRILNGPVILAAAAREAVKQWHFKPFLQNGQPVETQARITVNFTISTN
jgi:protein TonB